MNSVSTNLLIRRNIDFMKREREKGDRESRMTHLSWRGYQEQNKIKVMFVYMIKYNNLL